ncbi:hypothetical protein SFUMM280S_08114 [Streptomyces fumanus]
MPLAYDSVFAAPTGEVTEGTFEYRTVWRLGKPVLEVEGVREAVAQAGGTVAEGRTRLPLADAGTGPFTGVRGKAVLARLTEGTAPAALAQAAQDAGAKALFVTDDRPGRLLAWWGTDDNADRPLTIATLSAADAARLRAAGRVDMTGTPETPYTYDLSEGHPGAVPDRDLVYRPGPRDLAVLDTAYHADRARTGSGFRYSLTDAFPLGLGFAEPVGLPAERTEYVSTGPGQRWHESVSTAGGALEQRGGVVRYRGGTRSRLDWFRPVWHPWLGTGLDWGQQRMGDRMRFNAPGWGDSGPDHTGSGDVYGADSGMRQRTAVYLDGAPVGTSADATAYVSAAPPGEHTYRLVTDTALDAGRWTPARLPVRVRQFGEVVGEQGQEPAGGEPRRPRVSARLRIFAMSLRGSASTCRTARGRVVRGEPAAVDMTGAAVLPVRAAPAGRRARSRRRSAPPRSASGSPVTAASPDARVLQQRVLDLPGADLVPAALDQVGGLAADDPDVAVGVADRHVAGAEEAVRGEGGGGGVRAVERTR